MGCGVCGNVCPVDALGLHGDCDGFLKPVTDADACVNCGKCDEVCPVQNPTVNKNTETPDCYACVADDEIREGSSSGGFFPVLAEYILNEGGVVCGAAWQNDLTVKFIIIDDLKDIHKLQRSKYVQCITGDIYIEIKNLLIHGQNVLFTGLPCHVAALYNFLGEDYDNLFTIDILCNHAPSAAHFKKYRDEEYGEGNINEFVFRNKRDKEGIWNWTSGTHKVRTYEDEEKYSIDGDAYQAGFQARLFMNHTCENCLFCGFPRLGDATIGDFWGIGEHDPKFDDKKGTSVVLTNNDKGQRLLEIFKQKAKICETVPLAWVMNNRVHNDFPAHPARDRFYELVKYMPFGKAVRYCLDNKWDVGIVGVWSVENYGSNIAYYALYRILRDMGLEPLMIERPYHSHWQPNFQPHAFRGMPYRPFDIAPIYNTKHEMEALNDCTDVFLVGSDQLFYNDLYHAFGKYITLDWVHDDKVRSSYAASFGFSEFTGSKATKAEMSHAMRRFDYFSVREDSGVTIARDDFGVTAQHVLDPVLLCETKHFDRLAEIGERSRINDYCAVYLLDSTETKLDIINHVSKELKLETHYFYAKEKIFYTKEIENKNEYVFNEDWLSNIINGSYFITDSFHGVCLAIIYEKPFIAVADKKVNRGLTRFTSLLRLLKLDDRLIYDLGGLKDINVTTIDYSNVTDILNRERIESMDFLKLAVKQKNKIMFKHRTEERINKHEDFITKTAHEKFISLEGFAFNTHQNIEKINKNINELHKSTAIIKNDVKNIVLHRINRTEQLIDEQNQMVIMFGQQMNKKEQFIKEQQQMVDVYKQRTSRTEQLIDEQKQMIIYLEHKLIRTEHLIDEISNKMVEMDIKQQTQIKSINKSKSYLIGRIITFIPRKLIKFFTERYNIEQ